MQKRIDELRENLEQVKAEIARAAEAAGRSAEDVQLVAVSKIFPAEDVMRAFQLGQTVFGENRVQELVPKMEAVHEPVQWHLIGTLQRNKVKYIIGKVALIHSVHQLKLLDEIERQAAHHSLIQDVLLQLNIAEEESKHGFEEAEADEAVQYCLEKCPHVRLRGFMTMAPFYDDSEQAYPVFKRCFDIYKRWQERLGAEQISVLSMGMSHDFAEAIRAGATHVRIGSKIFGERHYS